MIAMNEVVDEASGMRMPTVDEIFESGLSGRGRYMRNEI